MDHVGILKNAFHTTIRYRALWVLGMLWALAGGGGAGFNFPSSGSGYRYDGSDVPGGPFGAPHVNIALILSLVALACGLFLILIVVAPVVRYTLQAGVYRSLHAVASEGVTPTVRKGFREGWHRRTWRLFLQDLLVGIPLALVALLALALALSPLLLLMADSGAAKAIGIATTVGLVLFWVLLLIVIATVVGVLSQLWWRAAAVGDEDSVGGIRTGWRLARHNLGDVAIMWLLMLGAGLLWGLLMIPAVLILVVVTGLLAAGPGFLIYQATDSLIPALLWGVPVGLVLFVLPLVFLGGIYLVFQASVWNQVYEQLVGRPVPAKA